MHDRQSESSTSNELYISQNGISRVKADVYIYIYTLANQQRICMFVIKVRKIYIHRNEFKQNVEMRFYCANEQRINNECEYLLLKSENVCVANENKIFNSRSD